MTTSKEELDQQVDEQRKMSHFESELRILINNNSMENGSDTPDWMLAQYLTNCLDNFNTTVKLREKWYGRDETKCSEAQTLI
jgi:hypothetical protein